MKEVKIQYQCPCCHCHYNTKEEAEQCYQPIHGRFKQGDIIHGSNGRVYKIRHIGRENEIGAGIERVMEYTKARGLYSTRGELKQMWMVGGSFWCHAQKVTVDEAQSIANDLRKRLKEAEKFLAMVKQVNGGGE